MLFSKNKNQQIKQHFCPGCQSALWDIYLKFTNKFLIKIDELLYGRFKNTEKNVPVIFIIGPPRSGTTLLYQTIIDKFEVFYPTNILWKYYRLFPFLSPALFKLSKISSPPGPLRNYESFYGRTKGKYGPSEFGEFWYKFFARNVINPDLCVDFDYVSTKFINQKVLNLLKDEINYIYSIYKKPIVFKNVYNTVRVHGLIKALPKSVFIATWRNPLYLSASIFNARIKKYGDEKCWMSVAPKEIENIYTLPVWDQIMLQIYYIYKQILEYIKEYGSNRFFIVTYEELTKNPEETLGSINQFLKSRNISLNIRKFKIQKFTYRRTKPIIAEATNIWIKSYKKYNVKFNKLKKELFYTTNKGGREL